MDGKAKKAEARSCGGCHKHDSEKSSEKFDFSICNKMQVRNILCKIAKNIILVCSGESEFRNKQKNNVLAKVRVEKLNLYQW